MDRLLKRELLYQLSYGRMLIVIPLIRVEVYREAIWVE